MTKIRKIEHADVVLLCIGAGIVLYGIDNQIGTLCIGGLTLSYLSFIIGVFVLPLQWANQ